MNFYFIGQIEKIVEDAEGVVFEFNILGTNHPGLKLVGVGSMKKTAELPKEMEDDLRKVGATFWVEVEEEKSGDSVVQHTKIVTEHGQTWR